MAIKNWIRALYVLLVIFIFACENHSESNTKNPDLLLGYWVDPIFTDSTTTFKKATTLKENEYGIVFQPGKLFIERKNSGWCGTPPVAYADFEGTWSRNDSIIKITVGYWGGLVDYKWVIYSLDEKNLILVKK